MRNQGAAERYRARATEKSDALEATEVEARAQNETLRVSVAKLQEQVLVLRGELLQQVSAPDCNCVSLQRYIHRRTRAILREAGVEEEAGEKKGEEEEEEEKYQNDEDWRDAMGVQSSREEDDEVSHRYLHSLPLDTTRKEGGLTEMMREKKIKVTRKKGDSKSAAAVLTADRGISARGAWGLDRIPLVVDFSAHT